MKPKAVRSSTNSADLADPFAAVGAVYDRAYFVDSRKARGHRPRLQRLKLRRRQPRMLTPRVPASGFTLVEVLVALTILSMSFAVLFSLASRSLDGMGRAREVQKRVEFARTKMAEVRLLSDLEAGDSASGQLEDGTRWTIEILPFVQPVNDGVMRNQTSVVQVRLTLNWQGRREPQTWTIDSYRFVSPSPLSTLRVSLEDQLRGIAR